MILVKNKAKIIAPVIGAIISSFLLSIYVIFSVEKFSIEVMFALIKIFPLLFFICLLVFYFFSFTIGLIVVGYVKKNFISENMFIFYCSIISFIVGIIFLFLNYLFEENIIKAIILFLCSFLGGLFSSTFYVSLKRELGEEWL